MDEQKKTRLAAALTVNVKSEIERYEQLIENGNKDLDYLKSEQYLLDYAMQQLGFIFPPKN